MQLKSDAGNLDSHITPLGHSFYFIRPISLGLVAFLKMSEHFRMLIIRWPWKGSFASGQLSLGGRTAVLMRMVVLSSSGSQVAPVSCVFVNRMVRSQSWVSLTLMEVFLFDCRIFCSDWRFLRR